MFGLVRYALACRDLIQQVISWLKSPKLKRLLQKSASWQWSQNHGAVASGSKNKSKGSRKQGWATRYRFVVLTSLQWRWFLQDALKH